MEGPTLVAELLASPLEVRGVFLGEELDPGDTVELRRSAAARGVAVHGLATGVAARVADTTNPQPALAVAVRPHRSLRQVAEACATARAPLLVLVDVADPGNAGTLVRTAEAAGAVGVVCAGTTVDPFGPKAVRAAAGAAFRLPIVEAEVAIDALGELGRAGVRRLAAVPTGGDPHDEADLTGPVALVLGSEAHGLTPAVTASVDGLLTIPMHGPTESLSVGAAGAVLCFEAAHQRRQRIGRSGGEGTG